MTSITNTPIGKPSTNGEPNREEDDACERRQRRRSPHRARRVAPDTTCAEHEEKDVTPRRRRRQRASNTCRSARPRAFEAVGPASVTARGSVRVDDDLEDHSADSEQRPDERGAPPYGCGSRSRRRGSSRTGARSANVMQHADDRQPLIVEHLVREARQAQRRRHHAEQDDGALARTGPGRRAGATCDRGRRESTGRPSSRRTIVTRLVSRIGTASTRIGSSSVATVDPASRPSSTARLEGRRASPSPSTCAAAVAHEHRRGLAECAGRRAGGSRRHASAMPTAESTLHAAGSGPDVKASTREEPARDRRRASPPGRPRTWSRQVERVSSSRTSQTHRERRRERPVVCETISHPQCRSSQHERGRRDLPAELRRAAAASRTLVRQAGREEDRAAAERCRRAATCRRRPRRRRPRRRSPASRPGEHADSGRAGGVEPARASGRRAAPLTTCRAASRPQQTW